MRRAKEKNITINGVTFELYDDGRLDDGNCLKAYVWDSIRSIYGKPSERKVAIWEKWCTWVYECAQKGLIAGINIASHNCMQFSIYGEVRTEDGTKYELFITRYHNRAFRTHKPMA